MLLTFVIRFCPIFAIIWVVDPATNTLGVGAAPGTTGN